MANESQIEHKKSHVKQLKGKWKYLHGINLQLYHRASVFGCHMFNLYNVVNYSVRHSGDTN